MDIAATLVVVVVVAVVGVGAGAPSQQCTWIIGNLQDTYPLTYLLHSLSHTYLASALKCAVWIVMTTGTMGF